jgi:hypothetical protein
MSKAGWAGLILLGAGFGLAAFIVTAGIRDFELENFATVSKTYSKQVAARDVAEKAFDTVIQKDPGFLEELPEIKALKGQLAGFKTSLAAISKDYLTPGKAFIASDNRSDGPKLYRLAEQAERDLKSLPNQAIYDQLVTRAGRVLAYKVNHVALVTEARKRAAETPKTANEPGLELIMNEAKVKYPNQSAKIDQKMKAQNDAAAKVHKGAAELEAKLSAAPKDYLGAGRLVDGIIAAATEFQKLDLEFRKGLSSLSVSIDKVLIDMKKSGGSYYHKYKIIEGKASRESGWEKVTASFFKQNKSNLGMSIYSKPEGVFEEDAVRIASPPGYNYVGNQRYGHWQHRNGRSFWAFYGQYHFMRSMFWGRSYYSPIYRTHWSSYRHNMRRGRSYYGSTGQFGTNGSRTRARYKKSAYFKSSASRGSSGRYSGSRHSGSSRSGGNRSSRYRSSSYGGSGK